MRVNEFVGRDEHHPLAIGLSNHQYEGLYQDDWPDEYFVSKGELFYFNPSNWNQSVCPP